MFDPEDRETTDNPPSYTLHPIRGAVWAAFWGGPVAAGIVLAINYWRIGRRAASLNVLVLMVFVTACFVALLIIVPQHVQDQIPDFFYNIGLLIFVSSIAQRLQGGILNRHVVQRGVVASAWPSVAIGLLCLPLFLGSILAAVLGLGIELD